MRRSKRIETLDQRPVNLDGYINEWPEMGFVAMTSPYDPKPSVKVANGRIVELDGKKREDFDFIDQFIADYAMNVERAEASMAVSSLEIARMIVDIHVSRKEILELVTGITPAKMTEVMNHLNVVELMMGMQKIRARRTPGNQAHITNLKDDPVQIAADAAEGALRGFAEEETTTIMLEYFGQNTFEVLILLDNIQIKNKNEQDDNSDNNEDVSAEESVTQADDFETGSITVSKDGHFIHCLTIIGQIEGHYILPSQNKTTKYEHVIPQLVAIEESKEIEGLLIILNTVGGDVEAGLAIAELLSTMKTPTASLVLGGGHSIGVPLAVSCKKSFIVPSATMTVHPVRMNGLVLGVPQTLSYFEKMQDRIVNFVVNNSSIDKKSFKALMMKTGELVMDVGTVLDGEDAVNCGLIDELGGLSDALDLLDKMIEER